MESQFGAEFGLNQKRAKNVLVSFSKRKQGLFGKASELCTKFNAQIAILVLSPSYNPYAFGHSSVDAVLRRYHNNLGPQITATEEFGITAVRERQRRRERELLELKARAREKEQTRRREAFDLSLINDNVEECQNIQELEGLKLKYMHLLHKVTQRLSQDSSFGSPEEQLLNYSGASSSRGDSVAADHQSTQPPTIFCDNNDKGGESDDFFSFGDNILLGQHEDDYSLVASSNGGFGSAVTIMDDYGPPRNRATKAVSFIVM